MADLILAAIGMASRAGIIAKALSLEEKTALTQTIVSLLHDI
jgi:hypothetical protein